MSVYITARAFYQPAFTTILGSQQNLRTHFATCLVAYARTRYSCSTHPTEPKGNGCTVYDDVLLGSGHWVLLKTDLRFLVLVVVLRLPCFDLTLKFRSLILATEYLIVCSVYVVIHGLSLRNVRRLIRTSAFRQH